MAEITRSNVDEDIPRKLPRNLKKKQKATERSKLTENFRFKEVRAVSKNVKRETAAKLDEKYP